MLVIQFACTPWALSAHLISENPIRVKVTEENEILWSDENYIPFQKKIVK